MDTPIDYISYMLLVNSYNLILMAWTYRSSNINYCCYCIQYKRYSKLKYLDSGIDNTVICYKCCPRLIENAEEKRQELIEHYMLNTSIRTIANATKHNLQETDIGDEKVDNGNQKLIINGTWEINEIIGKGAFGIVYRCTNIHKNTNVAAKFAIKNKDVLINEIKILKKIYHNNVIRLYYYHTDTTLKIVCINIYYTKSGHFC